MIFNDLDEYKKYFRKILKNIINLIQTNKYRIIKSNNHLKNSSKQ